MIRNKSFEKSFKLNSRLVFVVRCRRTYSLNNMNKQGKLIFEWPDIIYDMLKDRNL